MILGKHPLQHKKKTTSIFECVVISFQPCSGIDLPDQNCIIASGSNGSFVLGSVTENILFNICSPYRYYITRPVEPGRDVT